MSELAMEFLTWGGSLREKRLWAAEVMAWNADLHGRRRYRQWLKREKSRKRTIAVLQTAFPADVEVDQGDQGEKTRVRATGYTLGRAGHVLLVDGRPQPVDRVPNPQRVARQLGTCGVVQAVTSAGMVPLTCKSALCEQCQSRAAGRRVARWRAGIDWAMREGCVLAHITLTTRLGGAEAESPRPTVLTRFDRGRGYGAPVVLGEGGATVGYAQPWDSIRAHNDSFREKFRALRKHGSLRNVWGNMVGYLYGIEFTHSRPSWQYNAGRHNPNRCLACGSMWLGSVGKGDSCPSCGAAWFPRSHPHAHIVAVYPPGASDEYIEAEFSQMLRIWERINGEEPGAMGSGNDVGIVRMPNESEVPCTALADPDEPCQCPVCKSSRALVEVLKYSFKPGHMTDGQILAWLAETKGMRFRGVGGGLYPSSRVYREAQEVIQGVRAVEDVSAKVRIVAGIVSRRPDPGVSVWYYDSSTEHLREAIHIQRVSNAEDGARWMDEVKRQGLDVFTDDALGWLVQKYGGNKTIGLYVYSSEDERMVLDRRARLSDMVDLVGGFLNSGNVLPDGVADLEGFG